MILKKVILVLLLSETLLSDDRPTFNMYTCQIGRVAFIEAFNSVFSDKFKVDIPLNQKGGVPFVLKGLMDKNVTLGVGCRKANKDEISDEIEHVQVAWSALSFITNQNNSVNNISTTEIKAVLDGNITNWKALGGDDKPIKLYLREATDKIGILAKYMLFENKDKKLTKNSTIKKGSDAIRKAVALDRYSLAIDTIDANEIEGIKTLSYNDIQAIKEHIETQKYEMIRPFYLFYYKKHDILTQKYIDFALSIEGQEVISKENFTEGMTEEDTVFEQFGFDIKSK
ncbi:MAG: substrate-binding domain-containing protein [Sulfurovaceae bacterium]|nr:substrate-binding domain-containing protein [Sulfurovaceae bacterium]